MRPRVGQRSSLGQPWLRPQIALDERLWAVSVPFEEREARSRPAEFSSHYNEVTGQRPVTSHQFLLVVGPADHRHSDREDWRADEIAAGDHDAGAAGQRAHA